MITGGITAEEIKNMRDGFIEGVRIKTPVGEAKLIKKYPNFAVTDKGNWKWVEIFLAEHGGMCEDRKKLIKEKIEEVKVYYENRID